jgi:transcriptional regulator with XRE-family HTH domain
MPTGKQIRAARMLVDWDADELAKRIGMSRVSIQNIERGDARPKTETMEKIVRAFFDVGIEFTENEGLRRRPHGVEIFEGPDRFDEFYDFLYDHMLDRGGEVCLSVVDERLLAKYRTNPEVQRQRMRELVKSGQVTYRVLVTEGDFTGDYVEYRQQPAQAAAPTAFYAFGECLALISFPQNVSPHVVVIRSEPLTQAYRQAFHAAWEKAKPLSADDIKKQKKHRKD